MAKFYVLCDDDCRYEGMTAEQILTAIQQAVEQGYVSDPDGAVFSKIKEIKAGASVQMWLGTEAEFNAIMPASSYGVSMVRVGEDGVLYICSDDSLGNIITVDDTVTADGTNAVSGAAVVEYVASQLATITDYEGAEF